MCCCAPISAPRSRCASRRPSARGRYDKAISADDVKAVVATEVEKVLAPVAKPLVIDAAQKPFVILVVGVNGSGKTTTIGKLAAKLSAEGRKVMLAAGDTFRAAAIEQLKVWGERTKSPVIAGAQGSDSASLAFNALTAAKEQKTDVLLVDTAGRLQNKAELMNELEKVVRVIKKVDASAPHAVLLVLDATVGQNALSQVEAFHRTAGVTGLVMTKLDGTARGGILVALSEKFKLPVHFIGVGEGVDDLAPFTARDFAQAIAGIEELRELMDKTQPHPLFKLATELGPLIVFFVANAKFSLFVATGAFMVAIIAAMIASYVVTRHVPMMAIVTGVIVIVFGTLTLVLHDETFIKVKPTIIYGLFAAILGGGLLFGRSFIAIMFDQMFNLTPQGWRILTMRWALFFFGDGGSERIHLAHPVDRFLGRLQGVRRDSADDDLCDRPDAADQALPSGAGLAGSQRSGRGRREEGVRLVLPRPLLRGEGGVSGSIRACCAMDLYPLTRDARSASPRSASGER